MELAPIHSRLRESIGLDPASVGEETIAQAVRRRISASGCLGLEQYVARLDQVSDELQALVEEVIVSETWFFREESAFEALRQYARKLSGEPGRRTLSIASLPCATGEEAYSSVMVLLDLGIAPERFRVHAMDVSARSLLRAQDGLYGEHSFRSRDKAFRERYFESVAGGYRIRTVVREQVGFFHGSALAPPPPFDGSCRYDVVFCRNMLIYMDSASRSRVAATIRGILAPSGILLAAHAETALLLREGFERAEAGALKPRAITSVPVLPTRVAKRTQNTRPPRLTFASAGPMPFAQLARPEKSASLAGTPTDQAVGAALEKARALADAGHLEQAQRCCTTLVAAGVRHAELYYVMGLVLNGQGLKADAREWLRKAVYLNPAHEKAALQLALALHNEGEEARARRLRETLRRKAKPSGEDHG